MIVKVKRAFEREEDAQEFYKRASEDELFYRTHIFPFEGHSLGGVKKEYHRVLAFSAKIEYDVRKVYSDAREINELTDEDYKSVIAKESIDKMEAELNEQPLETST